MSFNNHDADDPTGNIYGKKKVSKLPKLSEEDVLNGRAIKIYTMASTMPLKNFMEWYKQWVQ